MQNITQYSDNELSLMFSNDESLYNQAKECVSFDELESFADAMFIYTTEQLHVLRDDFNEGTVF